MKLPDIYPIAPAPVGWRVVFAGTPEEPVVVKPVAFFALEADPTPGVPTTPHPYGDCGGYLDALDTEPGVLAILGPGEDAESESLRQAALEHLRAVSTPQPKIPEDIALRILSELPPNLRRAS